MAPIHDATKAGDLEHVKRLVQQDPQQAHCQDELSWRPFHYACCKGHASLVAYFLDQGAQVNEPCGASQSRCGLYWACMEGHQDVVELLLQRGADPTLRDHDGWTCLMVASCCGRLNVVEHLLLYHQSARLTINICSNLGVTALWAACSTYEEEVVRVLLEAGADPTLRDDQGRLPRDMVKRYREGQSIECLLQEWERSYILTKARRLYDAYYDYYYHDHHHGGDGIASYLKGRVEGEEVPLPKVEIEEKDSLVGSVLEYVICGGLKRELFVELMEVIGRTGVREGEED